MVSDSYLNFVERTQTGSTDLLHDSANAAWGRGWPTRTCTPSTRQSRREPTSCPGTKPPGSLAIVDLPAPGMPQNTSSFGKGTIDMPWRHYGFGDALQAWQLRVTHEKRCRRLLASLGLSPLSDDGRSHQHHREGCYQHEPARKGGPPRNRRRTSHEISDHQRSAGRGCDVRQRYEPLRQDFDWIEDGGEYAQDRTLETWGPPET